MRRSDLAYRFLPQLIAEFNKGNINQAQLLNEKKIKEIIEVEENDFNSADFKIEYKILSETKSVGIFIFPEPLEMVEAKFGLLIFDSEKKNTKYFTLEKSMQSENGDDRFMIGSTPTVGKHINYGYFEEVPTLENFLNHILARYEKDFKLNKFNT